jgi:hypothetical protein
MSTKRAHRAALATALAAVLSGCVNGGGSADGETTVPEPSIEVPETVVADDACEWLGFKYLDTLGAEFGYETTNEAYHEDGGCNKTVSGMGLLAPFMSWPKQVRAAARVTMPR